MTKSNVIAAVTAAALTRRPILKEGCVVAVSGGPDSVALLHAVVQFFRERPCTAPLVVGHVNHRLRGQESDADEDFVRELFAALFGQPGNEHLRLACTTIDVAALALARHENLEGVARKLRYEWLTEQAKAHAVRWVLTAHTLNDQAETTLFHILRGTGIRGLRGMRPVRRLCDGVWLMRPWLGVHKAEVLAYLNASGIGYRHDSSNQDLRFTRNRIRHDLLPRLQADYNSRIQDALAGLAKRAAYACKLLDAQALKTLERIERERVDQLLIFDRPKLTQLSAERLQSLFAFVWRRENWPRGDMGLSEWERLANWTKSASRAIDLPVGIRAVKKRSVVQLGPHK
jgi:tRNA(Ile)-lysidine synthase